MTGTTDMFPGHGFEEDENRRYTSPKFMAWIKDKCGVTEWDVDVAADEESHWAPRWFSLIHYEGSSGIDGLAQSWLPPESDRWRYSSHVRTDALVWRIFCNPPFDDLLPWVLKVWATILEANALGIELVIGFVLPGNRHEQRFWQSHVEPYRFENLRGTRDLYELSVHFPPQRQAYGKPGSNGVAVGSAEWPSALLRWVMPLHALMGAVSPCR